MNYPTGPVAAMNTRPFTLRATVAALASIGMLSGASVWAQEAVSTQPAAGEAAVVVVSGVRRAAQSAQKIKQDADEVIDSIVADDIGKFPDNNVAQTMARVTGIQVQRENGEANAVLVRGLPGIATLLNGRELFTTTGRFIKLQDIPSAMLQRVDVYKSQSADLIEGGIAGAIDVRTNRPFDFKGLTASVNAGIQSNDKATDKTDPLVNGMVSNRWKGDFGEFGMLFGLSHVKNTYHEERAFSIKPELQNVALPTPTTVMGPFVMGIQSIPGQRERTAENFAAQWRPNANVELYVEGLNSLYKERSETDFFVGLPFLGEAVSVSKVPGTQYLDTLSTKNTFTIDSTQARKYETKNRQLALGGRWNATPSLKLSSELARTTSQFNWANPILDASVIVPNVTVRPNVNRAAYLSYTGIDMTDPKNFSLAALFDRYGYDKGSSTDWRADATYTPEADGLFKSFSTGVRLSQRKAESIKSFESSTGAPPGTRADSVPGLSCVSAPLSGDYGLKAWYTPCSDVLLNNTGAVRKAVTGSASARALDPGSFFSDEEKNVALYGKANFGFDLAGHAVDGALGVRVTKTTADLVGKSQLANGTYQDTPKSSSTTDVLPSLSLKMKVRSDLIARVAVFKTLTRPDFEDLNPGTAYIDAGPTIPATASGGNSDLKPITGSNFDAALEWYFSPTGMVSGTVFRHNFADYILKKKADETFNGRTYSVERPFNTSKGHLQGVELAYQQFFDRLPGWLGGFGVQANATFTKGEVSTADGIKTDNTSFPDVSKLSYNLVALYERGAVSARLAYNWRSKYLQGFGYNNGGPGLDLMVAPTASLDGSISYKITPKLALTLTGQNLTNYRYTDYWKDPELLPRDSRLNDRTVGLFLNWKH